MKKYPMTCFVAGTMILTATGYVAIENIKVGDTVIATDPDTSTTEERRVVQTYINQVSTLLHLTIHKEVITTTIPHPFYVKERGFVKVTEFQVGDEILNFTGGSYPVEKMGVEVAEKLKLRIISRQRSFIFIM